MQLVVKRPQDENRSTPERHGFKSGMSRCRSQGIPLHVEEYVHRMRSQHHVDQDAAEIDDVLDRVHGKSGPGANVVVSVMQRMGDFVKRLPVQETMNKVKVQ